MGTREDYEEWARAAGFELVAYSDLSRRVAKTWTICAARFLRAMLTNRDLRRRALGSRNRLFAGSLPRLMLAYRCGAMRYGVFTWKRV